MATWREERHNRIPAKVGDHAGGWRFVIKSPEQGEFVVRVLADEVGRVRLSLARAREGLAQILDEADLGVTGSLEVRMYRDGSFYIPPG